jgi:hypothetical protein
VSIKVVLLFSVGYRKPIYSQLTVKTRIALRSIRKRSGLTTSSAGCALLSLLKRIFHSRLFPTHTIPITREFLTELAGKHDIKDALFLVDDADDLIGESRRESYSYRIGQHGFRNFAERVFRKVERRTSSFFFQGYIVGQVELPLLKRSGQE